MKNRVGCFSLLLMVLFSVGQSRAQSQQITTLKVKIEAPELDKSIFIKKLNEHGADHNLRFEVAETDYSYRIVFATRQDKNDVFLWGSGGGMNTSAAGADVFDPAGKELFKFVRNNRGTDAGATNAVAKEVIKRLLRWRTEEKQ